MEYNFNELVGITRARDITPHLPDYPNQVCGIDFSGAKDAGARIWVASAVIAGDVLKLEDCYPAKFFPGSSRNRDQCLAALTHFISTQRACAFGLDFPFGLPRSLVAVNNWEEFVLSFCDRYQSPAQFKRSCLEAANGQELKRLTDQENRTPFSPYNLRLYRQTYFGIRNVLAPLVLDRLASILPMQSPLPGRPWVFEICPASTLKVLSPHLPYKGTSRANSIERECILKLIEDTGSLLIPAYELRNKILGDSHGDALDSVIAAFATFRALHNLARSSFEKDLAYGIEGYVYV